MTWEALALYAAMGLALAACAGLRAFLPLLALGLAGRLGLVALAPDWSWMSGTPALVTFGVAVLIETLADKLPAVDHVLDVAATVVKPLAGGLLVGATLAEWTPLPLMVLGILTGGAVAGTVHLGKGGLRLLSSMLTGGLANPILSLIEDGLAFVGTLAALIVPLVALVAVLLLAVALWRLLARRQSVA